MAERSSGSRKPAWPARLVGGRRHCPRKIARGSLLNNSTPSAHERVCFHRWACTWSALEHPRGAHRDDRSVRLERNRMQLNYQAHACHRFTTGNVVRLNRAQLPNAVPGLYEITAILSEGNGERRYRIKSNRETYERVVQEHQLQSAEPDVLPFSRTTMSYQNAKSVSPVITHGRARLEGET